MKVTPGNPNDARHARTMAVTLAPESAVGARGENGCVVLARLRTSVGRAEPWFGAGAANRLVDGVLAIASAAMPPPRAFEDARFRTPRGQSLLC